MQTLTDDPRNGLDPAAVSRLLQGDPAIEVRYGASWLNPDFLYVADISGYMADGSTLTSDVSAMIHRACSLVFDSDVPFHHVTDFVQPYMVLRNPDTNFEARFNLGVYTLATPTYDNSVRPAALTFTGYDLLYYLNFPLGDSFEVGIGQDPVTAAANLVAAAIPQATLNYEPSGVVTTRAMTWPFTDATSSFTYLGIINQLLASVGYAPIWVDWNGHFQLMPFTDPLQAPIEWTFDLNATDNIIAEPRTSTHDTFTVPNWWRFVMQNLTAPAVEGVSQFTYIDTQSQNMGSYPNRNRYVRKTAFVAATTYKELFQQAIITIQHDLSPTETFAVASSPFPLAWHNDVIQMVDENLTAVAPHTNLRRVRARAWTLPLDGATDMTWVWETVNVTLSQDDYAS